MEAAHLIRDVDGFPMFLIAKVELGVAEKCDGCQVFSKRGYRTYFMDDGLFALQSSFGCRLHCAENTAYAFLQGKG